MLEYFVLSSLSEDDLSSGGFAVDSPLGTIDLYAMDLGSALTGGSPKAAVKLTRGEGIDGESRPAWGK